MNKKGALELSITAIVVLIIAITLLGLAIFFIRNLFSEGTTLFEGELAGIKDQLNRNFERTGETIALSKGSELKVKRGQPFEFNIGVKNTEGSRCFRFAIYCETPATPGKTCVPGKEDPILVGGIDKEGKTPENKWFPTILGQFPVGAGDIDATKAILQVPDANPDLYRMALQVYKGPVRDKELGACSGISPDQWTTESRTFSILLS